MALLALAFEISTRNQSRLPSSDCPSIVLRGLPPPSPSLPLHCKLSIVLQIFANLTKPKPRPRPVASLLPRFQCKHKQTNANKTRRRRPINKGPMRGWTHPVRPSVRSSVLRLITIDPSHEQGAPLSNCPFACLAVSAHLVLTPNRFGHRTIDSRISVMNLTYVKICDK